MDSPGHASVPQAAYSEAEFVRILRMAAELQGRTADEPLSERLTLAQIQEIASEVGIEPKHVAAAAALVATEASEQWKSWLATPVQGRLSRVVPGTISEHAWHQLASVIRRTLNRAGQHSYVPGALEWVHTEVGSEVRVEVSNSQDDTHVQISVDHRQTAALYLLTAPVLGASLAPVLLAMLGWKEAVELWLLIGGGAGAGFSIGWAGLKAVSARWQRRLRSVLQVLAETAASDHDETPTIPRA